MLSEPESQFCAQSLHVLKHVQKLNFFVLRRAVTAKVSFSTKISKLACPDLDSVWANVSMISSSNVRCASDRHASERDQYSGLPMTLTEMPSSLKRRIVGLAAIVGVIFLINFPSSTAAVCVIGLLSVGILYSLLEESKQSEEGLVQNRSTQLNRANIQAALKKYSQDAEKRFGPGQAPAAHESKAGPDKYTNAQENHATNFARTVIPQSNNTVAEQNQSQSTFNMQRAGHAPDQIASRNEAVKLGKGSSSERYVPNGLAEAIPVVKNGKVEDKPNQPNGKSGGPPLAGGAAVLARLRWASLTWKFNSSHYAKL